MALDTPLGFGRDVGVAAGERQESAVSSITPPRTQGRRRRHCRSKPALLRAKPLCGAEPQRMR